MKRCIINLPSLTPPFLKETLYAYLAVSKEAVSYVLLTDRKGKQSLIHYISCTLNEAERNYDPMEKLALSLVYMTRRLRRYFEAHPVKVITDQPIKHILSKTEALGKLAKYAFELGAYNITFEPRNVVKGQVLADFITKTPDGELSEEYFGMPKVSPERVDTEEWTLFTDRASSLKGSGAGLVLIGPGINRNYLARSDGMVKYLAKAKEYIAYFKSFSIKNIPRNQNQKADVLSKLASVAFNHLTKEVLVEVLNEWSTKGKEINVIVEEKENNWMTPIIQCLKKGVWSEDRNEARNLRVKINQYAIDNGVLFKKSYLVPMLRVNKSLMEGIKTRLGREKDGWVDEPLHVLWAHQTSIKTSNKETPFSLTYGSEAVIPIEIGMPTYRTMMIREGLNEEEIRLNLDLLTKRRELATI
ncbi:reverse transcriptase domain-containing protein [Tanacetum coccineum]